MFIDLTCHVCGKTYEKHHCKAAESRYCSRACRVAATRKPRSIATCEVCGRTYTVKAYRADTTRFCSFACSGTARLRAYKPARHHAIGNKFRLGLKPANAGRKFPERSGPSSPTWVAPLIFTCQYCGNGFTKKPWQVRRAKYKRSVFCSRRCFLQSGIFQGERSTSWVGGPNGYRGRNWRTARTRAVERDRGRCLRCRKYIGPSIPVHHRRPFREFASAEEANRLGNLVCLCQSCHMKLEPRGRTTVAAVPAA